ncbi:MAG: hypothetical protein Q9207_007193 [Kuettlingeria erythrocarpa]
MPPTLRASTIASSSSTPKPFDPRTRVAVTKARDARIIATISRNRTESPLLSLPDEILERIFIHVVGGQVVHIECSHRYSVYPRKPETVLDHDLCTAREAQEMAYWESKYGRIDVPASGEAEDAEYSGQSYSERHADCFFATAPWIPKKPQLSLTLLRVCRQAYEMGDHVLLRSNTFAFSDTMSLDAFIRSLHAKRKAKISKLQMGLHWERMWGIGGPELYDKTIEPLFRVLKSLESYEFELHHKNPYVKETYEPDPMLAVLKEMPIERARVMLSGYHAEEVRVLYRRFACQIELEMTHNMSGGPWDLQALCKERLQVEREEREALIRAREEKKDCPHEDQVSGRSAPIVSSATTTDSFEIE